MIDSSEVDIEYSYKPTKLMLADLLTKLLQGDLLRAIRRELLNYLEKAGNRLGVQIGQ